MRTTAFFLVMLPSRVNTSSTAARSHSDDAIWCANDLHERTHIYRVFRKMRKDSDNRVMDSVSPPRGPAGLHSRPKTYRLGAQRSWEGSGPLDSRNCGQPNHKPHYMEVSIGCGPCPRIIWWANTGLVFEWTIEFKVRAHRTEGLQRRLGYPPRTRPRQRVLPAFPWHASPRAPRGFYIRRRPPL